MCENFLDDSINFWKSRKKRSAKDKHGCGLHGRVRKDMEAFQKSVILDNDPVVSSSFKVHHPIQDSFPYRLENFFLMVFILFLLMFYFEFVFWVFLFC